MIKFMVVIFNDYECFSQVMINLACISGLQVNKTHKLQKDNAVIRAVGGKQYFSKYELLSAISQLLLRILKVDVGSIFQMFWFMRIPILNLSGTDIFRTCQLRLWHDPILSNKITFIWYSFLIQLLVHLSFLLVLIQSPSKIPFDTLLKQLINLEMHSSK